jgi:hypothetical protein
MDGESDINVGVILALGFCKVEGACEAKFDGERDSDGPGVVDGDKDTLGRSKILLTDGMLDWVGLDATDGDGSSASV